MTGIGLTGEAAFGFAVPEEDLLGGEVGVGGVEEGDGEGSAGGGLEGDFAEGGGEGGEEFLGVLGEEGGE